MKISGPRIPDIPIRTKPEPECPECGEKMILRLPREDQSWRPFWGCSDYPECHGSMQILENGEPDDDPDAEWEDELIGMDDLF